MRSASNTTAGATIMYPRRASARRSRPAGTAATAAPSAWAGTLTCGPTSSLPVGLLQLPLRPLDGLGGRHLPLHRLGVHEREREEVVGEGRPLAGRPRPARHADRLLGRLVVAEDRKPLPEGIGRALGEEGLVVPQRSLDLLVALRLRQQVPDQVLGQLGARAEAPDPQPHPVGA